MPSISLPATRRAWILVCAAAGGVVLAGYLLACALTAGSVPEGTTVAGLDVGGGSAQDARSKLAAAQQTLRGSLAVAAADHDAAVDLAAADLRVDPASTVDQFTGFTLSPARLMQHWGDGAEHPSLPAAPNEKLDAALRPLATAVRTPPTEAGVTFEDAEPKLVSGAPGETLSPDAATALRSIWLSGARPLRLPTAAVAPSISEQAARTALTGVAATAVSGPLTLVVEEREITLEPEVFASTLAVVPGPDGELTLTVDGEELRDATLEAEPELGTAPKDASFRLRNGEPEVVPGVEGVSIDPASLASSVVPALTSQDRRADVRTTVTEPELTTAEAEELGVRERVSTFSTVLTSNANRTTNLRTAARTVDGVVVLPGETFSLNEVLGRRTPEKGYKPAPAISNGRLINDYGGGVSQMATTIFNNVFFSGLEDVYHKPHSFYISRYPEGREATVDYPSVDLKWRNDSPHAVLIEAKVTTKVTVSFYSTKTWDVTSSTGPRTNLRAPGPTIYDEGPECVVQVATSGFDVTVTRTMRRVDDRDDVRKQSWRTTYLPEDKVVCGPEPD